MTNNVVNDGRKTEQAHWDTAWSSSVRPRLPSRLNVGVLNVTNLLGRYVKPGDKYLEIGCAPGKLLAWVSKVLKAKAAGLDYSEVGINQCRYLFRALNLEIDLFQEDLFCHQLPSDTYDLVCSFGVIEHFDEPGPDIQKHLEFVKPGGTAVITIPNYGGIYGSIQKWCDEQNLKLHNLNIMHPNALTTCVNLSDEIKCINAYPFGKIDPWILNLDKKFPRWIAKICNLAINAVGLAQPVIINKLAPMLVLEIRKSQHL